jgi:hypothetical protein
LKTESFPDLNLKACPAFHALSASPRIEDKSIKESGKWKGSFVPTAVPPYKRMMRKEKSFSALNVGV